MITKIEMQAMDAIIGIHREMRKANEIDWEQRRYEIAKELFIQNIGNSLISVEDDVKTAVKCADLLINELKNKANNETETETSI
ncbi:hypothetical protein [uncultured Prevotella sp.]|jgi:hypothetical protein|uniref:hypothetical protein n=1 Tax=uncultured Prevotella sp. TaxID=159272 RepID=UPI002665371F|nr:hypothetical protein [uncultured Prevotella sp.]